MQRLLVLFFVLFISAGAFAVIHPGPKDQIADRLAPFGSVCRAGEPCDVSQDPSSTTGTNASNANIQTTKVELSSGSEHTVRMLNIGPSGSMVFDPPVLKVSLGDTVHFKATDLAHNSASIAGMIPANADGWAGALNEDISVKLESEGVYVYQCDPHLVMAMIGVIQVGEAINLEEIQQSAGALKSSFAMNAERLETYLSRL